MSLAFGSLFWATPAKAEDVALSQEDPMVVVVTTPGGDDSSYEVPLTTTITFDGVVYDSVYVTTNSVITFGRPDGTYWDYPQTPSISLYSMDWVVFPWSREDEHLTIAASDGGFQVDISARPIWLQNATEPTNINIVAAINTDGTVSISYSLTGPTYDGQTRTGVRLTNGDVVTLEEYGVVQVEEPPVLAPEPVEPTPELTPEPEVTESPTVSPEPTVSPFINVATNVSAILNENDVTIEWDAPTESNTVIERYTIGWSTDGFQNNGWGWVHDQLSVTIPLEILDQNGGLGNDFQFRIRADNDTESVYSNYSEVVSVYIPQPEPEIVAPFIPEGATIINEGGRIEVIAPEGQQISSIIAWYGDPNDSTRGVEVSSILTELASGETSVTIESSNIYGDPAPGTVKVLIVVVEYGPLPEVTPTPTPEPTPEPSPEATPEQSATPEPERLPSPEPTPEPTPEPEPVATPEPVVTPEPAQSVEPEPVVLETPSPEPTPVPSETEEPVIEETKNPTPAPSPTKIPTPEPTPSVEPEPIIPNDIEEVVSELLNVDVAEITPEQGEVLKELAYEIFESAAPGSEEYGLALEALAIAAEADDQELPEELAVIPLIGDIAGAALEVFNNLGNIGADMAPEQREKAEETVVAAVIVGQVAQVATTAAASASIVSASSSSRIRIK